MCPIALGAPKCSLRAVELPDPHRGAGEVLIRVGIEPGTHLN